jgi:hypothetical protein
MNHIDTDAVREHADALQDRVGAALQAARNLLQEAQAITYSNFTAVHIPLAVVYTEAWNFQNRDLETKNETAIDFRTNLRSNAQAWDDAEEKSTVRVDTGGGG